ncbi:hypothetical protein [Flavihumibacter fluvii]|uniref:hypothetical protein n=1 Tax=Flavihumibacter fluvii TaxID=2838157 RepID=UPI001BDE7168|nr:hypothetical protein [Flavihumibacter fluvii]ULQ50714.1 hypothetical protein KJS93_11540 [Flavihumibacter fluvii]
MRNLHALLPMLIFATIGNAQPKKREDSFFGIHFDFHATQNNKEIGMTFTPGMIDSFLTIVRPDFVQVDCKGHPGYSSYPTKVGNPAGGFTKDILKIWRDVTAKHNVALYVHYSGILDYKAVTDHPDWARRQPDGSPDKERNAYLGAYSELLLIPQLKEISDYGVNGAWVDGECWATQLDYSPEVLEKFSKETGTSTIPKSSADSNYSAFVEYNRKIFRSYLRKYIDAIHAYNPAFQITSNWSYSSLMPEPVDVNVDYLSGDVAGQNGVYNAAFQARCMALQGKPWDLMSWGFAYDFGPEGGIKGPKSLVQLEQEAAQVIAMGGGFQCYFTQSDDGSIKPWYFPTMAGLGKFCRDRQAFCKGAETVPQIGLWYSTYSKRTQSNQVYGWNVPNVEGILSLLLDGQNSTEILLDHQLKSKINQYPVIIIPEWTGLDPALKKQALEYVQQGGNLVVIGAKAVKEFEPELGVSFQGEPELKIAYFGFDSQIAAAKTMVQDVQVKKGTKVIGEFYKTDDFRFSTGLPVATVAAYGKGKISGVYADLSNVYYNYQARGYVNILNSIIRNVFPKPMVRITGSDDVQTTLRRKNGQLLIHLINTAGAHFNKKVYEYDHVPATSPLKVSVRTNHPVRKVVVQPGGKELDFVAEQEAVTITVPPVAIHSIVQIEWR